MRINFLNRLFELSAAKKATGEISKEALQNLAKKAEERLQSRLTNYRTLMQDVRTGDILEMSTGKKFTGKFFVLTDDLEHLEHVKDGKTTFILVRDKNGTKHAAIRFSKLKKFPVDDNKKLNWGRLAIAHCSAKAQMREQFVIKELMNSGKDSIVIQGNF